MEKFTKKLFTRIAEGHICSADIEDMAFELMSMSLNEKRDYLNMHKAIKIFNKAFLNGLAEYRLQFMDRIKIEEEELLNQTVTDGEADPNKLFTPVEVAEKLGVSRMTINNYINEGKLKASRLSEKKTRISEADLFDFINASKHKPQYQAA